MTVSVVAAYQSPTLFNILAESSSWDLKMAPLGDHAGLAELAQMTAPVWTEHDRAPEVVIVCSPAHLAAAREKWPRARYVWAVHNGYERWLLPPEHEPSVAGAVCFSEKVRWVQQAGRSARFFFVSPAYQVRPEWSWRPNCLWTLRNRPQTKTEDINALLAVMTDGLAWQVYGQDQQLGVADAERKAALRASCSAYVSVAPRCAGFGLAEHEAFAAGVPVIGGWWGDLANELPHSYWGLQHDLYRMRDAARSVCEDEHGATELSRLGMEYIRSYRTRARMDESIAALLAAIG